MDKRENLSKKDKILTKVITVLSITVVLVAAAYLVLDFSIPGLLPLSTALLMASFVVLFNQKNKEENKVISIICLVAAIINVISGILEIIEVIA